MSAVAPSHPFPSAGGVRTLRTALRVAVGVCLLTLASRVALPFAHTGVPFTLQGQAVLFVAASLGAGEGLAAVVSWLALAAMGAPVLALGAGGLAPFVGPTAGYLLSFPLVAFGVGRLGRGFGPAALGCWALGNATTLALGTGYLAWLVGPKVAVAAGLTPFVVADAGKLVAVFVARHLACAHVGRAGRERRPPAA